MPDSRAGRILGHFRLSEKLGEGGMGVVYRATDLRLQRDVALKVLSPAFALDGGRRARLLAEARAASAVNHPNVVMVHEIDSADGTDFIAMELVEGETLRERIHKGALPFSQAIRYASQIAAALGAAHAKGIIHRDLKPGNIMILPGGQIKVLDFGLAKVLPVGAEFSEAPTESMEPDTAPGSVTGTAAYMSPEQASGKPIDARSDIFSFGVVLYEMLNGRPPFQGASIRAILDAVFSESPASVRSKRPELPAQIDRILEKALAKKPGERYSDAQELASALAQCPTPSSGSRRFRLGVLVLGAAAVVVFVLWWRPARAPGPRVEHLRLLSTFEGSHRSPSLSPDGRLLAFVDSARGVAQVWLKSLGEGAPVQITFGDVPAARPRFSPKGDEIVFERRRRGIWSVPVLGGTPRRLVERGSCPNFFPDGTRIVFDRGGEIWTANLDGSEPRRVEGVPESFFSLYVGHCPAVSPDGGALAYFQAERGPNGDLWRLSTSGGEPRRLTFDMVPAGRPVFSRDGRFVLFASARSGARTLWRVPVAGGEPEPLTTGAGEDDEPEISGDGRSLVYTNTRRSWALMVLDPVSGTERQLIERRTQINGPVFSPAGDRISFFGWTEEREQLFVVGVDGQELQQVTHGRNPAIMPRWSADARSLFFFHEEPPGFHQVPVEGGAERSIVPALRWGNVTGAWIDPGGTRIAYTLVDKGYPVSTRVRDLASGRESVLADPVWVRSWSPDGTTIAAGTQEGDIVLCPDAGGPCREVVSGQSPRFSSDGNEILLSRRGRAFDDPAIQSTAVWRVGVDGTRLRKIATLEPHAALATPFDVSVRDEIVWVQFRPGREELWVATLGDSER